jgi:protocatechuate 3,4-dioxygenase, alpha subunit
MIPCTPSQTVGPFFLDALSWPDGPQAVASSTPGSFWLRGHVLDGAGSPVPDALVETWQARPALFGRCPTDDEGRWAIRTVRPGRVDDSQAPHIDVSVFARGLLNRVVTRVYFPDEADDPVLSSVPVQRRSTLIAVPSDDGYTFDIRLQGSGETVFFDV